VRAVKARFAQTKDCEECGGIIVRKRGAMTDEAWEEKRFCPLGLAITPGSESRGPAGLKGGSRSAPRIRANVEDSLAELADQPRQIRWHLKMVIKALDRRIQTLKGLARD
jgi:hypothetical protein